MQQSKPEPRAGRVVRARAALALLALACAGHGAALAECVRVEPGRLWNYEGTIDGRLRVRMTLVFGATQLDGVYFYASQLRDIRLRGRIEHGRDLLLEELDPAGKVTATFTGTFPERDPGTRYGDSPLQCDVIVATWRKAGAAADVPGLPVYLYSESSTAGSLGHRYGAIGVSDDEAVHRRSQAFWRAVKAGDRNTVVTLVRYPIDVRVGDRRRRINDAAGLLEVYDRVFTPEFVAAIAAGLPRNMFVRDEGAMLGDGQVWFGASGKVIALNN